MYKANEDNVKYIAMKILEQETHSALMAQPDPSTYVIPPVDNIYDYLYGYRPATGNSLHEYLFSSSFYYGNWMKKAQISGFWSNVVYRTRDSTKENTVPFIPIKPITFAHNYPSSLPMLLAHMINLKYHVDGAPACAYLDVHCDTYWQMKPFTPEAKEHDRDGTITAERHLKGTEFATTTKTVYYYHGDSEALQHDHFCIGAPASPMVLIYRPNAYDYEFRFKFNTQGTLVRPSARFPDLYLQLLEHYEIEVIEDDLSTFFSREMSTDPAS